MKQAIIYLIINLICILSPLTGYSQTESYYGWNGELKELHHVKGEFSVILTNGTAQEFWTQMQAEVPSVRYQKIASKDGRHLYRLSADENVSNVQDLKNKVSKRKGLVRQTAAILPVFDGGSQILVPDNKFMIKLRNIQDIEKLHELNIRHNVEIRTQYQSIPTMFSLQFREQADKDVFATARLYFERLDAEWSSPNFYRNWDKNSQITDPYFQYQYYMSQIKAPLAWDVSTGSDQVIVAVVDDGVMAHEDLPAARILPGYAHDSGSEEPLGNEAHGMAVAGIIAASHNNVGIAGLAPAIDIIPVRIFGDRGQGVGDEDVSDAFDFAITNGAHIINNSWGADPTDPDFFEVSGINQFINDHSDDHLFIFSSGNDFNNNAIGYPGYLDGVFTVGAVDQSDNVQSYSSTGSELNLVAPAGGLSTETSVDGCFSGPILYSTITLEGNVWTLDQDGADGRNPGDTGTEDHCRNTYNWSMPQGLPTPGNGYSAHFGGTSAAAPQAAGVAALMLSINSNLTIPQIQTILENTADQVSGMGGQPFTNEYGHGRLNAYEAVKEAMPNQYSSHSFTASATLPEFSRIKGSTSVSSGVTLTIASGEVIVIEGSMSGTNSSLAVNGRLIIEESANISNVNIDVGANGMVIIREGASISNGDIDVASGGELVIQEGATLSFGSGQGIISDGTVSVSGSQANPVVLEASGGSYWDGVHMYGSSGGFNHVRIDGAVNGLGIYNSNNVGIINTEITGSQFYGIHLSSSNNVFMSYLDISQNGLVGIYVDGGDANISHGNIHENGREGVYANGGSFVQGPNVMSVKNNVSSSLRLGGSSYMQLDFSSITSNVAGNYHALATTNSTMQATDNWWGAAPPDASRFNELSGSTIDYSMWLWSSPVMYKINPSSSELAATAAESSAREKTTSPAEMSPDNLGMVRAMLKATSPDNRQQGVDQLRERMPVSQRPWLDILEIEHFQESGAYEQAQNLARKLMADQSLSSSLRETAARRLFIQQLIGQHNPDEAGNTLEWITAITPEEDRTRLEWMSTLVEIYSNKTEKPAQAYAEAKDTNASDLVVSNYPNPFNPTTNIRYQITEEGPVVLVVYDMLGREIATLVNEVKQAGEYNAQFDAGSLSSGIYLYRLQAGNTVINRQMTLIK